MAVVSVKYLSKNRHGTYQYRRAIKPEHRDRFGGRAEYLVSLNTADKAEALRRFPAVAAAAAELFSGAAGALVLSPKEAQAIADRWLAAALKADDARRREADYPTNRTPGAEWSVHEQEADVLLDQGRDGDFDGVAAEVADLLAAERLALPQGSSSWRRVAQRYLLAKVAYLREMERRDEGDWSSRLQETAVASAVAPTAPNAVEPLEPSASNPLISELLNKWLLEKPKTKKTEQEWRRYFGWFTGFIGGDRVARSVTKADVRDFKEARMRMPARLSAK